MQELEKNAKTKNTYISSHIISSALNHIFTLSEDQIKLNSKVSANMNPYTSTKVGFLINQIGQLINEETQLHDSQQERHASILTQVCETNNLPKDNMFSSGASVFINQNRNNLQTQKEDNVSINSFKTSFSKSKQKTINSSSKKLNGSPENEKPQQNNNIQKHQSNISELVSLIPITKTGKSKSSAFGSSNNNQEKILEQLIDQYRDQKIMDEETKQRHIEKKKKMTNLLSKDQMILSFNYQGQFIKINKREFKIKMQKIGNSKMAESNLFPGNYRFWKTKKNMKDQKHTQSFTTIGMERESNLNKKPIRTSIETINEMKSRSLEVSKKRVIPPEDKIKFTLLSQSSQNRHDSAYSYKSNKPLTEDQIKAKNHRIDFLKNKLTQYHQKQKNFMPQWLQTIQNGCKVRIFAGKRQSSQNLLQKNNQFQDNRPLNQCANRDVRSFSEPRQMNPSDSILNQNLDIQIKCLSNLKSPQRKSSDLMEEWEKRKLIKTVEIRKDTTKDSKTPNKNSHTSMRKKSFKTQNDEGIINPNGQHKNDQQKSTTQTPSKRKSFVERKVEQDISRKQLYNPTSNTKEENWINLNLEEFKLVKSYLQSKNNIFQKKQSFNKYRTDSISNTQKTEGKKEQKIKQENQSKFNPKGFQTNINLAIITEEKAGNNNEVGKQIERGKKRNNNLSFSQQHFDNQSCSEKKSKIQGTISITTQRLKNTLLSATSQVYISPSSILYTHKSSGKNEKQNENIIEKSTSIHQLKRISQSQKGFLPIQSSQKQKISNEANYQEHLKKLDHALAFQKQKSTNKKISIIQRKNHSTILRTSIPQKSVK